MPLQYSARPTKEPAEIPTGGGSHHEESRSKLSDRNEADEPNRARGGSGLDV